MPAEPVRSKRHGTRRAMRRLAVGLVVGFALYSVVGFFVVPPVVRSQLQQLVPEVLGLDVTIENVRFNPYTLALTLRGLEVDDRFGDRLLSTDRAYVNAEVASLLRRAIVLDEVRIGTPFIGLRRLEDGSLNFSEPAERGLEAAKRIETVPRLVVDRFVLENGEVDLEDRVPREPLRTVLGPIELELRDLSTLPDDEGDLRLDARFERTGTLGWRGRFSVQPPTASGTIELRGLAFEWLWRYVEHLFRFDVEDGVFGATLSYAARLEPEGPSVELLPSTFEVEALRVTENAEGAEVLGVERVEVRGASMRWPDAVVEVEGIDVEGARVAGWLREDGTLNWLELASIQLDEADRSMLRDAGASNVEPDARPDAAFAEEDAVNTPTPGKQPVSSTAQGPTFPWQAKVGTLRIADGAARFEDRSTDPPVDLAISDVDVTVTGVDTTPGAELGFDVDLRVGPAGTLDVEGTAGLWPEVSADLSLALGGLDLSPAAAYLEPVARIGALSGLVDLAGRGTLGSDGEDIRIGFEGDAGIRAFRVDEAEGTPLLGWDALAVEGVRASGRPSQLAIAVRAVDVSAARARVAFDRDGTLNLSRVLARDAPDAAEPAEAAEPPEVPHALEIGAVRIADADVELEHLGLVSPWQGRLHALDVEIIGVSSSGERDAELSLEGEFDETGALRASGTLDPFRPDRKARFEAEARGIELASLSPFAEGFIGHRIDAGTLATSLELSVVEARLEGTDSVEIESIALGEKVESETALNLPFGLAIGLLEDGRGRIALDVPLSGDLTAPDFSVASVLRQAVGKVVGNVVKSPFRLLGNLVGARGRDLDRVVFEPGRAELPTSERSKLATLSEALAARPGLIVEVAGSIVPILDRPALRRVRLDGHVAERLAVGGAEPAPAGESPRAFTRESAIEALFAERFGDAALEALRERHTRKATDEAGAASFDDAGFYTEAERSLVEAEPVDDAALDALANARARSIIEALSEFGLRTADRVRTVEPARVDRAATSPPDEASLGRATVEVELALAPAR